MVYNSVDYVNCTRVR